MALFDTDTIATGVSVDYMAYSSTFGGSTGSNYSKFYYVGTNRTIDAKPEILTNNHYFWLVENSSYPYAVPEPEPEPEPLSPPASGPDATESVFTDIYDNTIYITSSSNNLQSSDYESIIEPSLSLIHI